MARDLSAARIPSATGVPGATSRVADELARAGALLATASGEPFGLAVVEAMAAGVPVVAAAAGGHLETIGRVPDAPMFRPHDVEAAAMMLRAILDDEERARMAALVRRQVEDELTIDRHVTRLLAEYERVLPAYPREVGRGEVTTE